MPTKLDEFRYMIDKLDKEFVVYLIANPDVINILLNLRQGQTDEYFRNYLTERRAIVRAIGRYKRRHELGTLDSGREAYVIAERRKQAEQGGFNPDIIEYIFREIIFPDSRQLQDSFQTSSSEEANTNAVAD